MLLLCRYVFTFLLLLLWLAGGLRIVIFDEVILFVFVLSS